MHDGIKVKTAQPPAKPGAALFSIVEYLKGVLAEVVGITAVAVPEGDGVAIGVDRRGLAGVVGPALHHPAVLQPQGVVEDIGPDLLRVGGAGPEGGDPLLPAGAEDIGDLPVRE